MYHGGTYYILEGVQNDVAVNLREHIYVEGKIKIAKACLSMINQGDTIFLDAFNAVLMIATVLMTVSQRVLARS